MSNELSQELEEKIKACKSAEELEALVEAEGIELSDDMLQAIAGGEDDGEGGGGRGCWRFLRRLGRG